MPPFGPIYCETLPYVAGVFPAEPFNTYSNLVIMMFALAGFAAVVRRAPRAVDLYVLCALLLSNGIGSFLWHGLRDRLSLSLDVWTGLLFLMALFFLWARRVMPLWQAVLFFVGFYVITEYFNEINLIPYGRWASMLPTVVGFGGYLVYRTAAYSRQGAYLAVAAIVSSVTGLAFRTIDRLAVEQGACNLYPVGTHFLWHMFLSGGAFLGLLAMITVVMAGAGKRMETLADLKGGELDPVR